MSAKGHLLLPSPPPYSFLFMVVLLLASCYAVLVPLGIGLWFLRVVRGTLGLIDDEPVGALTVWLGGVLLLTVLLEVASLVGPLHTAAHLAAAGVGGAGLLQPAGRELLRRSLARARRLHGVVQALAVLLPVVALVVATMPSTNIDTGIYHAQSLRWLEEVGVVPGLANLDLHIGFNSAWFAPEALFSWGRYVGSPLQVLNAVFFTLFGWYGLAGVDALLRGRFGPADVLRALLVALSIRLLNDLASLSPDLAVSLLLFYIAVQAVQLPAPRPGHPLTTNQVVVVLLAVFALTLKLSTLPVLLLGAWWVLRSGQLARGRFVLGVGGLAAAVMLPWLARNVLISGYLVFPVALDLFNPSWKFPLAELRLHSDYIREFAINKDYYGRIDVHGKPLPFWLPLWWRQQNLDSKVLLLALPALLLAGLPLGAWQHRRGLLPQASRVLTALVVALAGVAFWFGLAPAPRFGYGFLLAALALLLLPWLWEAARRAPRQLGAALALGTLGLLVATPLQIDYRRYILPPALTRTEHASLTKRVAAPDDQAFLHSQFPRLVGDTLWEKPQRSAAERLHLIGLLAAVGGVPGRSGLDGSGRGGLFGFSGRLVWPAPYPRIPVQPVLLPPVRMVQSRQDLVPWYAPFPFVARRRLCAGRGPGVADGFVPRVVPGIRDWRKEARW